MCTAWPVQCHPEAISGISLIESKSSVSDTDGSALQALEAVQISLTVGWTLGRGVDTQQYDLFEIIPAGPSSSTPGQSAGPGITLGGDLWL